LPRIPAENADKNTGRLIREVPRKSAAAMLVSGLAMEITVSKHEQHSAADSR
jgi:hypothetical protein